jgi:hypothetical protein
VVIYSILGNVSLFNGALDKKRQPNKFQFRDQQSRVDELAHELQLFAEIFCGISDH